MRLLIAAVLALLPVTATAEGCRDNAESSASMSCLPGTIWDEATATCIAAPSS